MDNLNEVDLNDPQLVGYVQDLLDDWVFFAETVFGVRLDKDQQEILRSVQYNKMTAVASGTARGKDFVTAVACMCFMYTTPEWNANGDLVKNTKVAMTAPSDRQVKNIMVPEISRLYYAARKRGYALPGRLVSYDIRTDSEEWFLTGFKASDDNHEAWSGFHAANTMFAVTEASGMAQTVFDAIEGNLQGNSRLLIVFNPNTTVGYAAEAIKSPRFNSFRLNSLTAPNVTEKREVIPGQVDYEWILDKVKAWCVRQDKDQVNEAEGDFEFEGHWYRPNDLFRVKVLGMFPKVSEDVLIPIEWIEMAEKRWLDTHHLQDISGNQLRLGVDVAGMGRDNTVFAPRHGTHLEEFKSFDSHGEAKHMEVSGIVKNRIRNPLAKAFIDTIGEGAGVYSRLLEQGFGDRVFSAKVSEGANGLKDITGIYEFSNMRSYLYWSVRDWLNPVNKNEVSLPVCPEFKQEATNIKFRFRSDGKIEIEPKEETKQRIKRSPDYFDSLALTFYPDSSGLGGLASHNVKFF
jgi:hypothetical protein